MQEMHMTEDQESARIARKLLNVSPDVQQAYACPIEEDGIQDFIFWTSRLVTTNEMITICRNMAVIIRREIPERRDGWAAAIYPSNLPPAAMGVYYIGWAGRPDEWHLSEGQERKATDHADWLTFRSRLQAAVAALGIEEERDDDDGDFKVSDGEYGGEKGPLRQTLFVNNPEFLTQELIAAIQTVLRAGRTGEVVKIFPAFGEPFDSLWEGLEVRSDSVVERWDRQEAEQLLGDRLKIPRYARDDG
jgi:hypothetical protein